MSEHKATLTCAGDPAVEFTYKTFSRNHSWDFGNGNTIKASAATDYLGDGNCVDPEQAYVASLSSCHMLTFLAICSMKKITVESYVDEAVGYLEKGASGKPEITRIDLHPKTVFAAGVEVSEEKLAQLHDTAHHECFLANSVKTEITTVLE